VARFDDDTAVTAAGDGVFDARMDPGWWILRGPNGGYVAAVVLRALEAAVADPSRAARSLTVHYLAPPLEGTARVLTSIERTGRQLSFVSGRLVQGERLLAVALAAFGRPFPGPGFVDTAAPVVAPARDLPPSDLGTGPASVPMRERYDSRWAIGPHPGTAPADEIGGWIRLAEPRPYDAALLVAIADAWPPVAFSRLASRAGIPTVDLTVHLRAGPVVLAGLDPEAHVLCVFRSRLLADGYLEEDGEIWSPGGVLLAQSRQLAVTLG